MCAGLALLSLPAFPQAYTFKQLSQEQGLDYASIRALLQDRTGFLWVGTTNGLYRYEGVRFHPFPVPEGLPAARVAGLAESTDGTLWAALRGGLAWRSEHRFLPVSFAGSAGVSDQSAITSDGHGGIYLTTLQGLFALRRAGSGPVQAERVWPAAGAPPERAAALFLDRSGTLWFGCGGSVCRMDGGGITPAGEGLPREVWAGLAVDRAGSLWARSRKGLYVRRPGASTFVRDREDTPPSSPATSLYLDPEGNLAVPTQLGLLFHREGRWDRLDMRHGLLADPVSTVFWDREGSPWIGFEAHGLVRWLGYGEWESWTNRQGLSTNSITAVARAPEGSLYVGTRYGLNRYEPRSGAWRHWFARDGLPNDEIRALVPDPARGLWVATPRDGLAWFDPSTNRFHPIRTPAPEIVSLSLDREGLLWAGTSRGLFVAVPRGPATVFEPAAPAVSGSAPTYRVARAADGTLWLAGLDGLRSCSAGTCRVYTEADGLRHHSLIGLAIAPDGAVWVAYDSELGVSRLLFSPTSPTPTVTHFNLASGTLYSDDVSFLAADAAGNVWAGTGSGVDRYTGSAWSHYGPEDGLVWPDTELNAFWPDSDGGVWIGTPGGLSHYRQTRPAPPVAPRVAISSVLTDDRPVAFEYTDRHRIPFRSGPLEFEFAALTFRNPGDIRYRYRIDGARPNWMETRSHRVELPDLAPGAYSFQVAATRGAVWGPPVRFSFEILSPWWASKPFRLGLALAFALLAVLLWQLRVRRLMDLKDRLETAVRERTLQLRMERDRTGQEKAIVEAQKLEIEKLLGKAREVNRLKDEFLANMSHEIRTPMNGVLGMTALALATELTAEQREYLRTVQFSARNLLHLLNEILDFSKIEAGRMELEHVPFSLGECARESLKVLASLAREKHLPLALEIQPGAPDIFIGDPQRLRQILLNLVSNAIKFTERGGVTVSIGKERDEGTRVHMHLAVADTGIGIPSEKLAVIFEPFRQADGSTTRKYGGSGLGLAICARLVKLMDGSIEVESRVGSGSRFHVRLPLCRTPVRPADPEPDIVPDAKAHPNGNGWPVQVLLVEDDPVSRRVATRILEKRGYHVVTAENGREALELLEQVPVELVLMDVQMPEVDGLTATRVIREREGAGSGPRLPIYILTANAMAGDRERCLAAGADGYLTKPLEPADLHRALDEVRLRMTG